MSETVSSNLVKWPLVAAALIAAEWCAASAAAQTPAPQGAAPSLVTITAGYEVHRDHVRYTFENPSSIDTGFLVRHSFTQTYVADNQWFAVAARFPLIGKHMETEFAFTPERRTPGSDFDTFHDPNNDIVVSGTAGEVRMRSIRAGYWSEAKILGLPWRVGYTLRRDRAQFLATDRIVTHSNPASEMRSPTYGRETTASLVHEVPIEVSMPAALSPRWSLVVGASVSPIIWARLTTLLPDKYPGSRSSSMREHSAQADACS